MGDVDWKGFLQPSVLKIGITLILPAVVAAFITRRLESVIDFYGYLLSPRMAIWNGNEIVYTFNSYTLLWIPFYLAACFATFSYMYITTDR